MVGNLHSVQNPTIEVILMRRIQNPNQFLKVKPLWGLDLLRLIYDPLSQGQLRFHTSGDEGRGVALCSRLVKDVTRLIESSQ